MAHDAARDAAVEHYIGRYHLLSTQGADSMDTEAVSLVLRAWSAEVADPKTEVGPDCICWACRWQRISAGLR